MTMCDSGSVYLIENLINGKKYVGQHNKPDPKHRWHQHKSCKRDSPLYHAFRKYGIENFRFSVLCVCPLDKLTLMEGYYAEVFETYVWDSPGGYNCKECSDSSKMSKETREKIRQGNLGRKHTDEAREKMRQSALGKIISLETREKMSKASLGRKHTDEAREKCRQIHLGKKKSPEAIEKMRQSATGRKMPERTPEIIENIRLASFRGWEKRRANKLAGQESPSGVLRNGV
jgi:group I intron endonuclease